MARRNVALEGTATAQSTLSGLFPASGAINNNRTISDYGAGGTWANPPGNTIPQWWQVEFPATMVIDEVDFFTYGSLTEPTLTTAIDPSFGTTGFTIQYWDGAAFQTLTTVTNNAFVWRKFTYTPFLTTIIRVIGNTSPDASVRFVEVEAWGDSVTVTEGVGTATGTATVLGVGGYRTTGEKRSGFGAQKPSRRRHR